MDVSANGQHPNLTCHALTRSGQPCRNRPLEGRNYCYVHMPKGAAVLNIAAPDDVDTIVEEGQPGVKTTTALGEDIPIEIIDAPADQPEVVKTDAVEEIHIDSAMDAPPNATTAEDPSCSVASPPTLQAATAAAVEELEVSIRNAPEGTVEQRDFAADLLRLVRENIERSTPEAVTRVAKTIRENLSSDYLDPDFWRGIGMVLQYQIEEIKGLIERRQKGEYTTDSYGMDMEIIEAVRPFMVFLYRSWWRVTAEGLEHVPDAGRALMVANHSGTLPWDGAMIATAVLEEHSSPRVVRNLHLSWFSTLPIVAPTLATLGQVQALPENAIRLLNEDELVCVFPEGLKGVGKLFKDRYKLARFGRGGFVQMALRTGAPLVPIAVVGAEETYPILFDVKPIARLLGFPYFPITPLFPWFGLLGFVPLPTKWTIVFHEPIPTEQYGPQAADNPLLVAELSEKVRGIIQETLDQKVAERKSVF
jgi:1-acyl-sn-glycerol-3-phosphate acyltransferase